jgi:hypothetical protein
LGQLARAPSFGDIDGDGFYDAITYYRPNGSAVGMNAGIGFGDGVGLGYGASGPYLSTLFNFAPQGALSSVLPGDYGWATVDANGDGLVDIVRNHELRQPLAPDGNAAVIDPTVGAGELLVNSGATWQDPNGTTGWQIAVPANQVPVVPDERFVVDGTTNVNLNNSSVFADLDGDGLPDIFQGHHKIKEQTINGPQTDDLSGQAWLNRFVVPVITGFPNHQC